MVLGRCVSDGAFRVQLPCVTGPLDAGVHQLYLRHVGSCLMQQDVGSECCSEPDDDGVVCSKALRHQRVCLLLQILATSPGYMAVKPQTHEAPKTGFISSLRAGSWDVGGRRTFGVLAGRPTLPIDGSPQLTLGWLGRKEWKRNW